MHDAATITLIILAVALLRRSLLTDPDADNGVRRGEEDFDEDKFGSRVVCPVTVRTGSPQPFRRNKSR